MTQPDSQVRFSHISPKAIRQALKALKQKNQKYLQHLQLNKSWRKIYNGLLVYNNQQQLPKLINLKLCDAKSRQKSFYNPFQKTPISLCYNKINRFQVFQKQAIFNLILHYDNKIKSDTNWNLPQPTIKSVVRALHISRICEKDDRKCFQDEVNWRVLQKQRFKGIIVDLDQLLNKGLVDYQPISQVMFNQ